MNTPPIVISGGGIAGLAAALALGRHDVLILEQAASFSDVGAGLQLGPNAVRALQKLGAWDAVEPVTSSPPAIHIYDAPTGKLLKTLKLGQAFAARFGAPYRVAHRADLHGALLGVVRSRPNVVIKPGCALKAVTVHSTDIAVEAGGESFSVQNLIAADGVHSAVRQQLFSGAAPLNSGHVIHRALVPLPPSSGWALDCVNLWLHPGGHVVHYPVGANPKLNIVAVTGELKTAEAHFANAAPALKDIINAAGASFSPWSGLSAPRLRSWTKGGVLLIGDAAHATLPYLAQGAAMALEDAACLASVLPGTNSLKHAFAETAARRMQRAARLQSESLSAGRNYHLHGPMRIARNAALRAMPAGLLLSRLAWIYEGGPG